MSAGVSVHCAPAGAASATPAISATAGKERRAEFKAMGRLLVWGTSGLPRQRVRADRRRAQGSAGALRRPARVLGETDHPPPFGAWLRGIAAKLVLDHRRKCARAHLPCDPGVLEALEAEFRRFEQRPGDSLRHRLERLTRCVESLPPLMRDAV